MIKFLLGETKTLKFKVTNSEGEDFTIQEANYKLYKANELVDERDCKIEGHELIMIVTPEDRGFYNLEITYKVNDETRMGRYQIDCD